MEMILTITIKEAILCNPVNMFFRLSGVILYYHEWRGGMLWGSFTANFIDVQD